MEDQNILGIFDDGYEEPKAEEKAALIAELQSGDYHLSFSALSAFAISPRAFIAYKVREKKTTDAMVLGEIVHCLVLEPDAFADRFFIAPNVNGATKEGKEVWKKIYADFVTEPEPDFKKSINEIIAAVKEHTKVTVVKGQMHENGKLRARAITKNRACRYVLDQITHTELSLPDDYQIDGVKFRGYIDGKGPGVICDIKNMPDATVDKASGSIWSRRLHWQAYAYDTAFNRGHDCYILAVDGTGETSVHRFSDKNMFSAERQIQRYITEFKRCVFESMFDDTIWEQSQDFWLRSDINTHGINQL